YQNGSLEDYLKINDIANDVMIRMAAEIAAGIHHLHSEGIVHRDIATRNCLLGKDLTVVISDFGTARFFDVDDEKGGQTQSTVGPIRWMEPESIKNRDYSVYSDSWMYGCLLYEIVEKKYPYHTNKITDIIVLMNNVADVNPGVPLNCDVAFVKIMQ